MDKVVGRDVVIDQRMRLVGGDSWLSLVDEFS